MSIFIFYLFIVLINHSFFAKSYASDFKIKRTDKSIVIEGTNVPKHSVLYIVFKSSRNNYVSHYSQKSKNDPSYKSNNGGIISQNSKEWNIFYPVVDIELKKSMKGRLVFEKKVNSDYSVNGMFFKEKQHLASDTLFVDEAKLFNWENNIYVEKANSLASEFFIIDSVNVQSKKRVNIKYNLLSGNWSGTVLIASDSEGKNIIESKSIYHNTLRNNNNPKVLNEEVIDRESLLTSLKGSIDFTLKSQNHSKNDPTKGGLNLFYDYETKSFRRSTWPWSWGPSIKMLLECSDIPEITVDILKDSLLKVALEIGDASLKFQNMDKDSPAYGVATSRWSETKNMGDLQYDYEQFYSVADGQFLAGWGWMPLYTHTGDKRFLEAARLQTQATERLMEEMGEIPMDYMKNLATWKDYMISEQGFGLEGINELYRVEPEVVYRQIGKDYLEMLLAKLDHQSGGWNRAWVISTQQAKEPFFYVRGHGWAMEGLTAGYELTKDTSYLAKAEKMADLLMKHQLPDGSWSVIFTQEDDNEISDKGTALWSLLFYRMYRFTQNEVYLQTARKALIWCLNNQYFGEDVLAYGSIPNVSRASGVIYRSWFPLACNYTTGFFGLAVLEELTLQNDSEK